MSTRSTISLEFKDGTVKSIYCHSDGYLSHNGSILLSFYNDINKVKEMINLGSMSSLDKNISVPSNITHDFNNRVKGVCTFYGRDRGEKDTQPTKYNNLYEKIKDHLEEYDYVFSEKRNKWFLINHDTLKLQALDRLIQKELKDKNNYFFYSDELKQTLDNIEKEKMSKKLKKTNDTLLDKLSENIAKNENNPSKIRKIKKII